MTWPCRLMSGDPGTARRPGDLWFATSMVEDGAEFWANHYLSVEYVRDWAGVRAPIVVVLPDGTPWCIDHRFGQHNGAKGPQPGWTITGTPPLLTAAPSILAVGRYHGWLQDGVLSDDLEGRTYP